MYYLIGYCLCGFITSSIIKVTSHYIDNGPSNRDVDQSGFFVLTFIIWPLFAVILIVFGVAVAINFLVVSFSNGIIKMIGEINDNQRSK